MREIIFSIKSKFQKEISLEEVQNLSNIELFYG